MDNILTRHYTKNVLHNNIQKASDESEKARYVHIVKRQSLTTKKAVELLLEGTLRFNVCRFCLNVTPNLSELDQILQISNKGTLYKVTLRDMIATFHPYKITDNPNLPNKVCNKCLDKTLSSYLFSQQCEQSERALRNCIDDVYEKLEKLDPMERPKKRGRQKQNPNLNKIYVTNDKVIDYADPIINLVNRNTVDVTVKPEEINRLECLKCCEILPSLESLLNHEKIHPKSMWYNCRYCGKSFARRYQIKNHIKYNHIKVNELSLLNCDSPFKCLDCGVLSENYGQHFQHLEKHKFQTVLDHLINRKMDKLCSICLNKDAKMTDLNNTLSFHGGYPELDGEKTYYNILSTTLPEMNYLNKTGTKICEKCKIQALGAYAFVNRTRYVRHRLKKCVTSMLDTLNEISKPKHNVFIEISQKLILELEQQSDDESLLTDDENLDISKLKIDVLEDEFRTQSESEETTSEVSNTSFEFLPRTDTANKIDDLFMNNENPAKRATRTYMKKKLNGLQENKEKHINNICNEFLTFKNKKTINKREKQTCPLCSKHFITHYHLKRHILKHIIKEVQCKKCKVTFTSKFTLYEHTKMVHLLNKTSYSSCKTCGRAFEDENKMKLHLRSHISKRCMLCEKLFLTQHHFNSHMQRHRVVKAKREAMPTCSFCEKECANNSKLTLHVNKAHLQIKPYDCDMCDKQFYVESNMRSHKVAHTISSKEICVFCDKTLKCRRNLVVHIRKHLGTKPNLCLVCSESFYSESKLKSHMKLYHGGHIFCKLCRNIYKSKTDLKKHVHIAHSGF